MMWMYLFLRGARLLPSVTVSWQSGRPPEHPGSGGGYFIFVHIVSLEVFPLLSILVV